MGRLFALILAVCLWIGFAAPASAAYYANLTPCGENPAFIASAQAATTDQAKARFERYSQALCGDDGLPHLIADGNIAHAGDFVIPGIMFLYIAGWIGWAGRSYLQGAKKSGNPEEKEIIIDIPVAIQCSLSAALWPLLALKEFTTGEMLAKDDEITLSPR
ncbi:MAG: Photosystem I reaction center subunit III [Cyanobacteria bacterium]|nr:Photosystem I reaction center subunit III [Cyanobacteriota bacterium]MDW8202118.1 Photosystem I reaction center subunit III [Cyanobacteriota bacterium SKYGB_h_bin112]